MRKQIEKIKKTTLIPITLVGTNADKQSRRKVSREKAVELAKSWNCPFLEISSQSGEYVDSAFQSILREIRNTRHSHKNNPLFGKSIPKTSSMQNISPSELLDPLPKVRLVLLTHVSLAVKDILLVTLLFLHPRKEARMVTTVTVKTAKKITKKIITKKIVTKMTTTMEVKTTTSQTPSQRRVKSHSLRWRFVTNVPKWTDPKALPCVHSSSRHTVHDRCIAT